MILLSKVYRKGRGLILFYVPVMKDDAERLAVPAGGRDEMKLI